MAYKLASILLPIIDYTKIGLKALQTNRLQLLFFVLSLWMSSIATNAQDTPNDTNNSLIENDSISKIDSIQPIQKNKSAVQYIIDHSADEYILEDVVNKKVKLYNKAHVVYDEYDITSGQIVIDYNANTVRAKGIPDKKGKYTQLPVFKTKANETTQDSLIFNYKSKKAIIYGLETEQDGINTLGEKTKRYNDSTIFVRNIIFTTSDPRNPDYYLKTTKAKIVPGKKIITGPTNLVLADVPTPAIFPFAYFPLTKNRTSGIIFPTYGESFNQGFFLQNGGYYMPIGDYADLKVTGDLYSNSSWGIDIASNYKIRYKFRGNFNFNYDNLITGIEGFSNFGTSRNFNLRWSHSQDSKSSPNSRFSTNVNLGSSQYFRQSVNESNTAGGLRNTLSSSITYYKKFVGTPFNMNVSANHQQNTNTEIVTATLPSLRLNMDRLTPFAPKSGGSKNAFHNIGLNYSFKAENRVSTTEDKFFSGAILDDARNGAQHTLSLSTNTKLLKYFSLSPSLNYREIWYTDKIKKTYNTAKDTIIDNTVNGFTSFRDYSASLSVSTTVYGMFKFKGKNLKALRHTMRPSVGYTYRPDFEFFYDEVQTNTEGTEFDIYNPFSEGIYGGPSRGVSNALSFNLDNTLEGKVKNKKDPDGEDKKIKILNALNFRTGYDFTREEFKFSNVTMNAGTILFKKMNVNLNATLDPYALQENSKGNLERINVLNYKNGGGLFRVTNARLSTGYSFSSKDFEKKKNGEIDDESEEDTTAHDQDLFGQNLANTNDFQHQATSKNEPAKKKDDDDLTLPQYISAIPWDIRFSYSIGYRNGLRENEFSNHTLNFTGDAEISPGWKVGVTSGYDFTRKGFSYTNFRFTRDLRSWSMNFNWVPKINENSNASYYFFIGVKASVLSDLKWDKRATNRDF